MALCLIVCTVNKQNSTNWGLSNKSLKEQAGKTIRFSLPAPFMGILDLSGSIHLSYGSNRQQQFIYTDYLEYRNSFNKKKFELFISLIR